MAAPLERELREIVTKLGAHGAFRLNKKLVDVEDCRFELGFLEESSADDFQSMLCNLTISLGAGCSLSHVSADLPDSEVRTDVQELQDVQRQFAGELVEDAHPIACCARERVSEGVSNNVVLVRIVSKYITNGLSSRVGRDLKHRFIFACSAGCHCLDWCVQRRYLVNRKDVRQVYVILDFLFIAEGRRHVLVTVCLTWSGWENMFPRR